MIYLDYSTCLQNCYKGICELTYNTILNLNEYTCKVSTINSYWWFMTVPGAFIILGIFFSCCIEREESEVDVRVETQVKDVQNQQKNVVHTQNTEQNVVVPQGQQVTLPNGQTGFFIALTELQQVQENKVHYQAPQFQQPIQVQQNKMQEIPTIEMPQMPTM
ncbi:Hypothetical_protein [Hexamita inflata]|uniref:Hypothetical_protein n=1 Tax=Hexamita inflata TaxID=28002 RepID=A0AA86QRF6_9EUKA|nr:Hypothetical protein HINF_LOCUS45519 [Hexamita inflata]